MAKKKNTKEYIIQRLRKAWLEHSSHYDAYRNAPKRKKNNPDTNRMVTVYKCASCKKYYMRGELEVDHIAEVGSFVDWNTYIERLFCSSDNLQLLCTRCHKRKTHNVGNMLTKDLDLV